MMGIGSWPIVFIILLLVKRNSPASHGRELARRAAGSGSEIGVSTSCLSQVLQVRHEKFEEDYDRLKAIAQESNGDNSVSVIGSA